MTEKKSSGRDTLPEIRHAPRPPSSPPPASYESGKRRVAHVRFPEIDRPTIRTTGNKTSISQSALKVSPHKAPAMPTRGHQEATQGVSDSSRDFVSSNQSGATTLIAHPVRVLPPVKPHRPFNHLKLPACHQGSGNYVSCHQPDPSRQAPAIEGQMLYLGRRIQLKPCLPTSTWPDRSDIRPKHPKTGKPQHPPYLVCPPEVKLSKRARNVVADKECAEHKTQPTADGRQQAQQESRAEQEKGQNKLRPQRNEPISFLAETITPAPLLMQLKQEVKAPLPHWVPRKHLLAQRTQNPASGFSAGPQRVPKAPSSSTTPFCNSGRQRCPAKPRPRFLYTLVEEDAAEGADGACKVISLIHRGGKNIITLDLPRPPPLKPIGLSLIRAHQIKHP